MRCELPELKRCCFCLPLRIGLIVWTYLKLASGLTVMVYLMIALIHLFQMFIIYNYYNIMKFELAVASIMFVLIVVDNSMCVVFLFSAHKKLYRIMRICYKYLIVMLGITTILFMTLFGIQFYSAGIYAIALWEYFLIEMAIEFVSIILQIYFIILVNSEIRKLSGNCEFRFENNAVEAECAMITNIDPEVAVVKPESKSEMVEDNVIKNPLSSETKSLS